MSRQDYHELSLPPLLPGSQIAHAKLRTRSLLNLLGKLIALVVHVEQKKIPKPQREALAFLFLDEISNVSGLFFETYDHDWDRLAKLELVDQPLFVDNILAWVNKSLLGESLEWHELSRLIDKQLRLCRVLEESKYSDPKYSESWREKVLDVCRKGYDPTSVNPSAEIIRISDEQPSETVDSVAAPSGVEKPNCQEQAGGTAGTAQETDEAEGKLGGLKTGGHKEEIVKTIIGEFLFKILDERAIGASFKKNAIDLKKWQHCECLRKLVSHNGNPVKYESLQGGSGNLATGELRSWVSAIRKALGDCDIRANIEVNKSLSAYTLTFVTGMSQ